MPTSASPSPEDRLDSWKEIAGYLKRGVRTVQRWERESGLPVHRLTMEKRGVVHAYTAEIDLWWQDRSGAISAQESVGADIVLPQAGSRRTIAWIMGALLIAGAIA